MQKYSTAVQALHCTDCIRVGEMQQKISAVPDWSHCFHCSHPTLLTAVMPAPLQKKKYKSLTVTAREATHETIRAKQSWFSTTNVAVINCKDGRTGLVLQGHRQPCCSSFLLLFSASNQGKRGSECRRAGGRQGALSPSVSPWKRHTPSPRTERQRRQTGFGLSLSAAASLPAPAPPPPHRPSAGERQKRNERSGVVYLRAD